MVLDVCRMDARACSVFSRARHVLLLGTIIGSGALIGLPGVAEAQTFAVSSPVDTNDAAVVHLYDSQWGTTAGSVSGQDLTITTNATVSSSNNSGIVAVRGRDGAPNDDNITINAGQSVSGFTNGVYAVSFGAGDIVVTGSGSISSSGNSNDGLAGQAINAQTNGGSIIVSGSGTTNSANAGIYAFVKDGSGDIGITRSGDISAATYGVWARNAGSGNVDVSGIGAVTATAASGTGIDVGASGGGNVNIGGAAGLDKAVSAANGTGVKAQAADSGTVTIKTVSGGTVSASLTGVDASSVDGAISIDLGANVAGGNGVAAVVSGSGAVAIKADANVSGTASGIVVSIGSGATNIAIGAKSTVSGASNAIYIDNGTGAVTVNNAGVINGSVTGTGSNTSGARTVSNSGTISLASGQSVSGFATVNQSGGVLAGAGNFGNVTAQSGSTLRAGDRSVAIGSATSAQRTFSATSLSLASGSVVDIRADYLGASDRIAASGAASFNGATLKVTATPKVDATWATGKSFTILTASSVTGTFGATQLDYAFLKATLSYTANSVSMTLDRNWTSFGSYAKTSSQKSVSDVFDRFQVDLSNPVISRVTTLTTAQAPVALAQLSGAGLAVTRTQSFSAVNVFSGAVNSEMGRFTGSAGGASSVLSYAEDKPPKSKAFDKIEAKPAPIADGRVWAHALGGIGNMKADGSNPSQRSSNYGLAAGADTALNPNVRAGFALSLGQSETRVSALSTKADSVWGQGALYAVATDGELYAKAVLAYGYVSTESERSVTAFGTVEKATGKFGANLVSARLEAGRKFAFNPLGVTPFFAFEPSLLFQNAYNEKGPSSITLGFDKTIARAMPGTLGVKLDADYKLGDLRMTPAATFGWVHNFSDPTTISPFFTALPGSNFSVQGAKGDRNLARVELNLEAAPEGSPATFYLSARADLGERTNAVRGTSGFSLRF